MTYKYVRPDGELHKISMRRWHKKFCTHYKWPCVAYVYLGENTVTVEYRMGIVGKVLIFILSPLLYVLGVIHCGHRRAWLGIKRLILQKSYGAFESEGFPRESGVVEFIKGGERMSDLMRCADYVLKHGWPEGAVGVYITPSGLDFYYGDLPEGLEDYYNKSEINVCIVDRIIRFGRRE